LRRMERNGLPAIARRGAIRTIATGGSVAASGFPGMDADRTRFRTSAICLAQTGAFSRPYYVGLNLAEPCVRLTSLLRFDHRGKILIAVSLGNGFFENGECGTRSLKVVSKMGRFSDGVPQVLGHQMQREIRSKVIGKGAGRGSLHQATAWSPVGKYRERLGEVQAAGADHIFGFSERSSLNAAHEIVDELHQRSTSCRTKMNEFAPQHCKDRLGNGESRV